MSSKDWTDDALPETTASNRVDYAEQPTLALEWGGRRWVVSGGETLGSTVDARIRINERTVSRLHGRVERRGRQLWIVDLESKNGTYVDGVRVGSALLSPGLQLALGDAELTVQGGVPRREPLHDSDRYSGMIGGSVPMRTLFAMIERVAPTDEIVLVTGETGTGKELVARALHDRGRRARGPYVVVDCGSIPENLVESELFGHTRGAFTGADRTNDGAALAADQGTLFLDEIGELPLAAQAKLLRFLETRTVKRVGASKYEQVDARIVAATHRNLPEMVARGAFREDLWFRLSVIELAIPPLRERGNDIVLLARHIADGAPLPNELLERLKTHPWPGNVRELRNQIRRALALGSTAHIPPTVSGAPPMPEGALASLTHHSALRYAEARTRLIDALEKSYLTELLKKHRFSVTDVAEEMELSRTHVHRLLKKHDMQR